MVAMVAMVANRPLSGNNPRLFSNKGRLFSNNPRLLRKKAGLFKFRIRSILQLAKVET